MPDGPVIGVSEKDSSSYWEMVNQGFRQAAERLGASVNISAPPGEDVAHQRELLEREFLDPDDPVDALAVVGSDPALLQEPISRALDEGIPVVCVDLDAPESGRYAFVASADPDDLGRMAGQELVDRLDGEGTVAIQTGSLDAPGAVGKIEGFREVVDPTAVEIVAVENDGQDDETALKRSRAILREHAIDGFYGVYARNAPLQAKAVAERGDPDDVVVVGFDMLPATAEYLRRGVIDASIWIREYYFGYYAAAMLFDMTALGPLETLELLRFDTDDFAGNALNVPPETYTPENVSEFLTWEATADVYRTLRATTPLPGGVEL